MSMQAIARWLSGEKKAMLVALVAAFLGSLLLAALVAPASEAQSSLPDNCQASGITVTCTFDTPGTSSWTAPEGVTQATLDVFGAQGGSEPLVNKPGGGGGMAHATIAVAPGDTLQVNVGGVGTTGSCSGCGGAGGAGGFNGGAAGGSAFTGAGGGGGASDIRTGDFALADRIIVAGGGGGAGASNGGAGGAGGGIVGGDGNPALGGVSNGQGGLGGTASSGGEGGAGGPPLGDTTFPAGENGTLGVGGAGGSLSHNRFGGGGGGGGGGYYGGGGGGSGWQGGGGGGGSGYVDPQASDVQFQSGVHGGNGLVTITYTDTALDTTPPTLSVTHTADGSNGWNKTSPVTLTVSASDSESGLAGDPTCTDGTTDLPLTAGSTTGTWTASVSGEGIHNLSCSVSDNLTNTTTASDTVKIDTKAPSASCSATPSRLRTSANNHKLVDIATSVTVSDPTGGSGTDGFTLVSVTSNQADSGLGPDDVPSDIQGWTPGTADTSGQVRAERYGGERVYTLTYQGKDVAGNTSSNCLATVTVPKKGG